MCNAASRIGGFLAPFATVFLVQQHRPAAAELLLGSLCLGAAVGVRMLPYETRGRDLQSTHLQPESAAGTTAEGRGPGAERDDPGGEQQGVHDPEAAVVPAADQAPLLPPGSDANR